MENDIINIKKENRLGFTGEVMLVTKHYWESGNYYLDGNNRPTDSVSNYKALRGDQILCGYDRKGNPIDLVVENGIVKEVRKLKAHERESFLLGSLHPYYYQNRNPFLFIKDNILSLPLIVGNTELNKDISYAYKYYRLMFESNNEKHAIEYTFERTFGVVGNSIIILYNSDVIKSIPDALKDYIIANEKPKLKIETTFDSDTIVFTFIEDNSYYVEDIAEEESDDDTSDETKIDRLEKEIKMLKGYISETIDLFTNALSLIEEKRKVENWGDEMKYESLESDYNSKINKLKNKLNT